MHELNDWNENEKFSLEKTAQDVLNRTRTSCVKTSCCIDTTKITAGPCHSIQTSCCIDTTKE